MSAAQRRRGADAERSVVAYLRANGWPDARRYLAGDGRQPGDVDWHPLIALEVKDRAESRWPTWCRQATAEARSGMVPVVVRRERGQRDVGAWECRMLMHEWLAATGDPTAFRFHGYAITLDGCLWWAMPFADLVAAVRAIDAPVTAAGGEHG